LRAVNIKHDIGDSQNTTKYLLATAGIQNSNNYMFRPFLVAIIRLYIPSFKRMYNMPIVGILYILLKLGIYNLMMANSWHIVHTLEARNIQPDDGH
jgi:hypothetical protein